MAKLVNKSLEEGYERYVVRNPEGCWGWKGSSPKNPGYGDFCWHSHKERAHRASWIIHFGPIPEGMYVCHHCDNPVCSKPEHLFLGKDKENQHDALKKGRHPAIGKRGRENPMAKLDEEKVRQIRKMLADKIVQKKIADNFGIQQTLVSQIGLNKVWGWVI